MPSTVRRGALALLLLGAGASVPLAVAGPAAARPQPAGAADDDRARVRTLRFVDDLPKPPREIKRRRCGRRAGDDKIRSRSWTRPNDLKLRIVTRFCDGDVRIRVVRVREIVSDASSNPPAPIVVPGPPIPVPGPPVEVPGPPTYVPVPSPPEPRSFRLTLLHNNDGESKLATGDSTPGYGGVARFKTVVDRLRAEAVEADLPRAQRRGTVVVSSGDNVLPGTNFTASLRRHEETGEPYYDALAVGGIGYDAVTLGNHDFDFGPSVLATFIEGTPDRIPFISANLDLAAEPALQALADAGRILDTAVVRRAGERIAVIGLTTPDLRGISSPGRVVVQDALAQIVNAEVDRLEGDGIDKIVLSSHLQGIGNDEALIPQLDGVDIVIAGGGDNLLADPGDALVPTGGDPANGYPTPEGSYPLYVDDATGTDVPVVTTAGEYLYVGRLTAVFDENGEIVAIDDDKSGPVRVSGDPDDPDYAAEDPALKAAVVDPVVAYNADLEANIVATSEVVLEGGTPPQPVRNRETNLGNLVADGFRWTINRDAEAEGRPVADIAFVNGGGVRVTLPAGDVSERDTFDVLPFGNFLVTVPDVSREKLKELMEWGVSSAPANNGKFPQISGFSMEVDTSRQAAVVTGQGDEAQTETPGERIRSLVLDDGTVIVEDGEVVPGPALDVATADFTANGGDNYPFGDPDYVTSGIVYQQSLFQYLTQTATVDGLTALGGEITDERYPVAGEGRITYVD